jgi:hypothetical protein
MKQIWKAQLNVFKFEDRLAYWMNEQLGQAAK